MNQWVRVSRRAVCPICGRANWCVISTTGTAALCPRTPNDRPIYSKRTGEFVAYLHQLDGENAKLTPKLSASAPPLKRNDLHIVAENYRTALTDKRLHVLARDLGVSEGSLQALHMGWAHDYSAYSFPMRDENGKVVGIRLRRLGGAKFAVPGGREGVFVIPATEPDFPVPELLIAEGPTDTAALLDMGYTAIGRPCCTGGTTIITRIVKQLEPELVVVVADQDAPGQRGAVSLASVLKVYTPNVVMITPPAKDIRQWRCEGATREDLAQLITQARSTEEVPA
jgi:hypothetical protein